MIFPCYPIFAQNMFYPYYYGHQQIQNLIIPPQQGSEIQEKQIQKVRKRYSIISTEQRQELINQVTKLGIPVKDATKETGIKLSTGKAILKTFINEQRVGKKKERQSKQRPKKIKAPTPEEELQKMKQILPKLKTPEDSITYGQIALQSMIHHDRYYVAQQF